MKRVLQARITQKLRLQLGTAALRLELFDQHNSVRSDVA